MEKNIEIQRKKREELEGAGRKKAGEALKDVDIKKMLSKLNPVGAADAATVEILMVAEKPKSKSKVDSSAKDQAALDKALRMDNKTEKERDARRSKNKVEIVDGKRVVTKREKDTRTRIEKEADLLEQERKKKYKRGKATKRAKGGLIDMRKTGLFR